MDLEVGLKENTADALISTPSSRSMKYSRKSAVPFHFIVYTYIFPNRFPSPSVEKYSKGELSREADERQEMEDRKRNNKYRRKREKIECMESVVSRR